MLPPLIAPQIWHQHTRTPGAVLKRGPGSLNNFYGTGVHQDYGLTPEAYTRPHTHNYTHGCPERPRRPGLLLITVYRSIILPLPDICLKTAIFLHGFLPCLIGCM